jgi:hypothetical protein
MTNLNLVHTMGEPNMIAFTYTLGDTVDWIVDVKHIHILKWVSVRNTTRPSNFIISVNGGVLWDSESDYPDSLLWKSIPVNDIYIYNPNGIRIVDKNWVSGDQFQVRLHFHVVRLEL